MADDGRGARLARRIELQQGFQRPGRAGNEQTLGLRTASYPRGPYGRKRGV